MALKFRGRLLDQPPKRKHAATGNPRGGKRPGAGRPKGPAALEYGEVRAVKAAGLRVPEGAAQEARELADEALGILADVMRGDVSYLSASHQLKAATRIREEVCGPLPTKLEHSGKDGVPLSISIDLGEGRDD